MRVLDESYKGVAPGDAVTLDELGVPVKGTDGLLIVFWKEK